MSTPIPLGSRITNCRSPHSSMRRSSSIGTPSDTRRAWVRLDIVDVDRDPHSLAGVGSPEGHGLGRKVRFEKSQLAAAQFEQNEPVAVEEDGAAEQADVEVAGFDYPFRNDTSPEFHPRLPSLDRVSNLVRAPHSALSPSYSGLHGSYAGLR